MAESVGDAPSVIARRGALVALYKPAGYAVHPTGYPGEGSVDLISWARAETSSSALSAINRLDRGASGLVLCSADAATRAEVGQWLADGEVEKEYRALVFGRTNKKGIIRRPLQDTRRGRALPAVTRYRLLRAFSRASYLRVRIETGRKHQIRRHLQGIGHPVIGDERYPPRRFFAIAGFPGRLWLHCYRMILPDGWQLRAPLPDALNRHLELLESMEPDSHSAIPGGNEAR